MNLEEFYAQIGGDYADTLQRLCNENMVKKFVKKYQDDPTCADLHNAVLQQDWEAAFRGAHTLKGVAQNLGFERLYQVSAVLTEGLPFRTATIASTKNRRRVTMDFTDFDYFAVWSPYKDFEVPFVCLEPWSTLPDGNHLDHAIEHKQGIRKLHPNESETLTFTTIIDE